MTDRQFSIIFSWLAKRPGFPFGTQGKNSKGTAGIKNRTNSLEFNDISYQTNNTSAPFLLRFKEENLYINVAHFKFWILTVCEVNFSFVAGQYEGNEPSELWNAPSD